MGGVGLKKTSVMNKTLLEKLTWRVLTEEGPSWCRVLRENYGRRAVDGFQLVEK